MKKIFLFLACAIIFSSCDVIEPGHELEKKIDTGGNNSTKVLRKILLEDFTGTKCPNCPDAAKIAHDLEGVYGDRLIVLGIHSGVFARPGSETPYDFRTSAGNELDATFKPSSYPSGMINRTKFNNSVPIGRDSWGGIVKSFADDTNEAAVQIKLTPSYDASEKKISVEASVKYLSDASNDYYLAVYVVEDSIIKPQLKGLEYIHDYVHMHVLRGSMNGTWGEQLSTGTSVEKGAEIKKNYSFTIPQDKDWTWRPENMKILALVHKYATTKEVVQVEQAKVLK